MRTYGNEIIIHRGEPFTIDKYLVNKDGSPFIVSKEFENPHLRVSVSDTLYAQRDRYIVNYFLSLKNLPRFHSTVPVDIQSFKSPEDGHVLYKSFDNLSGLPSGLIDGVLVTYTSNDEAVFFNKQGGSIEYKYLDQVKTVGDDGNETMVNVWRNYEFRLVKSFTSAMTEEWKSQNYWYDITLVSGPMNDKSFSRMDVQLPILNPTKLTVLSDLEGG